MTSIIYSHVEECAPSLAKERKHTLQKSVNHLEIYPEEGVDELE